MSKNEKISTWRERIGQPEDFPLHVPTDVERAMVEEIADLRAATGWISVESRLPDEELLRFLVTGRALDGGPLGVHMGTMCDGELYFDGAAEAGGCNPCISDSVTHWMPLPPAPAAPLADKKGGAA